MCVIIHKPAGVNVPSAKILETCHNNNPDGIGMMFNDPSLKTVIINKGFRNAEELEEAIHEMERTLLISMSDVELIIHFRWATHGEVSPNNCHPFPTIATEEALRSTKISCKCGIAHNGIINMVDDHDTMSDTMLFVTKYIADMNFDEIYKARNLIDYAIEGDRFIALSDDGRILRLGEWEERIIDGCYYSNWSYITSGNTYRNKVRPTIWDYEKKKDARGYYESGYLEDIDYDDNYLDKKCDICSKESHDVYHYYDIEGWDIELCGDCYESNKTFIQTNGVITDERFDEDYFGTDDIIEQSTIIPYSSNPSLSELQLPTWESISNSKKWDITNIPVICPYCARLIKSEEGFIIGFDSGKKILICRDCLSKVYNTKTPKYVHRPLDNVKQFTTTMKGRELICV